MSGVLHLCNILQFVINGFYDGPFSGQQSVRHTHQRTFHIALELCYQLYAVNEKPLEQFFANIPLIFDKFTIQEFHKGLVFKWFSVIDITGSNYKVEQFALLIADEVQFETKESPHGALPSLSDTLDFAIIAS